MSAEFGADSIFGQLFRTAYAMAVLCVPATESASDRVFKAVKYAMNADSPQRDSARGEQQVLVWRSMHCAFCGSCITRISISSFLLLAKPWDVYFSECISVITGDYVLCTRSWRAEMSSSPSTRCFPQTSVTESPIACCLELRDLQTSATESPIACGLELGEKRF